MLLKIKNSLEISEFKHNFGDKICERLTFQNPVFLEAERMDRWTGDIEPVLHFYRQQSNGTLRVPRGFISQLLSMAQRTGESFEIVDARRELPPVDFTFFGELRPYQVEAVNDMMRRHFGTLAAPTGSGKTVMGLSIIAQRKQPALVVVHAKELLNQWVERIQAFLGISPAEIGIIGDGKRRIGDKITVALVQSLYKYAEEIAPHIGHLIVDECHRAPSRTFTEAVIAFDCKYMLGLSATPWRRDKLSRLIFWHLGDVQHQIDTGQLQAQGSILRAEVLVRQTSFSPSFDPSTKYSSMLSELTEDAERNRLIAADIAQEAENGGGICLALSDRKAHCEALRSILADEFSVSAEILTGDVPNTERQALVERLNQGKVRVLIATGQLIGEGFDCRGLSTLFLCTPIKFSGRVLQYLGRVLRPAPGKDRAKVFDYVDQNVGVLVAAANARRRVYN